MDTYRKLSESYEWAEIPTDLPRENLAFITAKTMAPTIHPEDIEYPVRLFDNEEEMKESGRTLAQRVVGLNHMKESIDDAFVVDSQWNPITKAIEALVFLPRRFIEMIRQKLINRVSVEYTWRKENRTREGVRFEGLIFNRVDLLYGLQAGDSNSSIRLLKEGKGRVGLLEGEIDIAQQMISDSIKYPPEDKWLTEWYPHCKECKYAKEAQVGDYTSFKNCISKNKGKDDPNAYCASIWRTAGKIECNELPKEECKPECKEKCQEKCEESLATMVMNENIPSLKGETSELRDKMGVQPTPSRDISIDPKLMVDDRPKSVAAKATADGIQGAGVEDPKAHSIDAAKATMLGEMKKGPEEPEHKPEPQMQKPEVPVNQMTQPDVMVGPAILNQKPVNVMDPEQNNVMSSGEIRVEGQSLDKSTPIKGDDVKVTDQDKSKQRVESTTAPPKEEPKKEEPKKEPEKQPEKKEEPKKEEPKKEESKPPVPPTPDPKDVKIKELEETITKIQTQMKTKDSDASKLAEAQEKKKVKQMVEEIESILPEGNILTNFNRGGQILARDLRKILHKIKKENGMVS